MTEEEIECLPNEGYLLTPDKGKHFRERYASPANEFPDFCGQRLEALMQRPADSIELVLFGHSAGASWLMMSLQYPRVSQRLKGLITSNMGLDTSKFSGRTAKALAWKRIRYALFAVAPSWTEIGSGLKRQDLRVKGLDPPARKKQCEDIANAERTLSLGFGEKYIEECKPLHKIDSTGLPFYVGLPSLHMYCSRDTFVVPTYIRRFAKKWANQYPEQTTCTMDVAAFGLCEHESFPRRLDHWRDDGPWSALWEFLQSLAAPMGIATCPLHAGSYFA